MSDTEPIVEPIVEPIGDPPVPLDGHRKVCSSNVISFAYLEPRMLLEVCYGPEDGFAACRISGAHVYYRYFAVPVEIVKDLNDAADAGESVGKFLAANVKGRSHFQRV